MDLEQICREKGMKITDQRKVIVQVIAKSIDHPSAEDVYNKAIRIDNRISLATVYRTINLLESYGVIEKLEFREGKSRYEVMQHEGDHHHHLIDLETGKIIEFYDHELEEIKKRIAKKLGYRLVDHRLELYGIPVKGD